MQVEKEPKKGSFRTILTILGIVLIAANLRIPITSVGPVITEITEEFELTPVLVGLVTTIPLLSFGLLSTFTPQVAKKIGLEKILLYSMLVLALGLFLRSSGNVLFLFVGAAIIGAAITVSNVLMPAFIKKEFSQRLGFVTGMYLVSMNLVSALGAGYSIRIGQTTGLGWKGSIGVWIIPTLIALICWLPQVVKKPANKLSDGADVKNEKVKRVSLWKSRLAWQISLFMGLQSFLFYSFAAWLPTVLQSWGMSADRSGWMLSYIQMGQVPMMFIGPIVAGRMREQTSLVWWTFILLLIGLSGVIFWKTEYIVVSVVLIGVSLGLAFTLATMFFILRTEHTVEAAGLSGMSQSVGYLLAACGPPLFGALYSLTGNWYFPLALMVIAAIALFLVGLYSAKDRYVTA